MEQNNSMNGQFNTAGTIDESNKPSHSVLILGRKSEYWHEAVREWIKARKIDCTDSLYMAPGHEAIEYNFSDKAAAQEFIKEFHSGAFDVEARNIEMRAAGVKLEQAESPIAWAPSPSPENTN